MTQQQEIDQHDDDIPVGRVLTRREVLGLFGGVGAGLALLGGANISALGLTRQSGTTTPTSAATAEAAAALPSCVVRPALTEGPYFVDEMLNRADIRVEPADGSVKEGTPLKLTFLVSQITADACSRLAGAQVDIWHCDALGRYSDVIDTGEGFDTRGQKWLRGYQITDADGKAEFLTIYPGWYQGRAVHIHFKIRTDLDGVEGYEYEFTSQLFFDEALTDEVYAEQPYATKGAAGRLRNASDGIYQAGGSQLILNVTAADDGYAAVFDIGLDLSETPVEASAGGNPPAGTPGRRP